ncbi:hypothetical protein EVAR_41661_1 [Eumeta japonica]|uniref:Uncharacterized protein n=1 Tax=Eumeta variegata TaxID=151549 RepID=A0A4C1VPI8_EUMVA|nr:hypothetical protein EVAR_41661_1 [Eumeta japonica]
MLDALQRSVALKACRVYRTVSLHSALILARLLPLDIRVKKVTWLYEIFYELPHPAHVPNLGFESVEDLDPTTLTDLSSSGRTFTPTIAELKAKSVRPRQNGGIQELRISTRVLLYVIPGRNVHPALGNKEGKKARKDILDIIAEGREVCLLWVRAHAGTAGNEHADELASNAALKNKRTANYDSFPLSFAKMALGWIQDLLHVLKERSIFLKEHAEIEVGTGVQMLRENIPELLSEDENRKMFVTFYEGVLDEKVQQLTEMSAKKSIIPLNLSKFKDYVKSPPRDYSFVVMFTAMQPSRRCAICQHVYDEYLIVANSFRFSPAYNNKLFFGMVDFDEGSDIFQMLRLNTAPVIMHFPAKGKPKPADSMDFERAGIHAEAIAKWIQDRTDLQGPDSYIYGSESCVCQKKNESRINAVEMQTLHNMCEVSLKDVGAMRERCGLKEM